MKKRKKLLKDKKRYQFKIKILEIKFLKKMKMKIIKIMKKKIQFPVKG